MGELCELALVPFSIGAASSTTLSSTSFISSITTSSGDVSVVVSSVSKYKIRFQVNLDISEVRSTIKKL